MPERSDEQLAEDGATLGMWLKSEYYAPWLRVMEDALEDARARVLNAPVRSQEDFYAVLEAKGKHAGLTAALQAVYARITSGEKARERIRHKAHYGHP